MANSLQHMDKEDWFESLETWLSRRHDFVYPQQALDEDEIRILEIQPGGGTSRLTCRLDKVSRRSAEPYKALSYVWGTSPPNSFILIDGKPFWIRENLEHALYRIRKTDRAVRLWTDAICINQENHLERNAQVKRMGKTYSGAEEVLIWLGQGGLSPASLRDLCELSKTIFELSAEEIAVKAAPIIDFFSNSWFGRLWVLQEVVLARNATILLGGEERDLSLLYGLVNGVETVFASLFWRGDHRLMDLTENVLSFTDMMRLRLRSETKGDIGLELGFWDFVNIVEIGQNRACQDPRDHVFGLVGMAQHCGMTAQTVDYSLSPREVYQTFMQNALIGSLHRLTTFETGVDDSNTLQLPSWVPDISQTRLADRFVTGFYLAGGVPECDGLPEFSFSLPEGTMTLCGFQFDTVGAYRVFQETRESIKQLFQTEDSVPLFRTFGSVAEELWCRSLAATSPYGDRQSQIEACWRTLIGNVFRRFDPKVNTLLVEEPSTSDGSMLYNIIMERSEWPVDDESRLEDLMAFGRSCGVAASRSMLLTHDGYYGIGPLGTREGDIFVVVPGLSMPIVVRKQPNSDRYRFVGGSIRTWHNERRIYESHIAGERATTYNVFDRMKRSTLRCGSASPRVVLFCSNPIHSISREP
jgi:hypothetical protein